MTFPRSALARCLMAGALGICLVTIGCRVRTGNAAKIDQLFAPWDRPDSPGAAVVVVKDGAVVYQHGYGSADLEQHIPITPQTPFDIASLTKQFTGLSVAMLVQQGKLSLDDDIHQYLPDVPDFGKPIKINHLVHHTSGLRDWPETLRLSGVDWEAPITLGTILEMVRRQRELDFAPGEEYQYSNTGYNLLAAVVAKVTGQSFRAWTDTNLFRPLGMKHTQVCDDPAEIIRNRASSYVPDGTNKFKRVVSQLSAQGSSSLFVSAEDMGRWLLNFETGRVGGKAAIELMQQPGKLNSGKTGDYGFGLGLGEYHGIRRITHGGSWAGYRSFMMWMPEKRFAIAIFANTSNLDTYDLAMKITSLYLGTPAAPSPRSPAPPPAAVKADPATWDSFPGTYRLGPGWLLTITREGDQLMVQATREDKFRMTPVSDTNFFVAAYGSAVAFVRNKSGTVTNLMYRHINAPKLNLPESTPARLAAYAGDYWSEELRVVERFEIHDGKLAVRQRSGTWDFLLLTGTDRFDAGDGGIAFEFTRNAAAGVTGVKVSGGRVRNLRFTRVTLPQAGPAEPDPPEPAPAPAATTTPAK